MASSRSALPGPRAMPGPRMTRSRAPALACFGFMAAHHSVRRGAIKQAAGAEIVTLAQPALLGGVTAAVAAFLIGLGLRTFVIDRERRRMALALSRYLDVHLAQKLMESDQPPELGGETAEVTIWFSDIAGFSTVAETMEPRELVRELNAHFTMLGAAIEAEGGIIAQYVGDAVVAIFGALVPLPNHAAAAMRAALAAQDKLRAETGKAGAFRIRIGLNTGSCVVGNVGSINRINYTAIGDSVNVAARLEAANKELGTTILASESTVRAAGSGFVCKDLGPIHVKGRAEVVVVHEVVGLA